MATTTAFSLRAIAVVLAVAIATCGCATKLRHVPTQPLARQAEIVIDRDRYDCEQAITGTLKGAWFPAEVEYASCLVARNYQVWVQVLDASVELRKASLKSKLTPARVTSDMLACERYVQEQVTVAELLGRPAMMVAGMFFLPVVLATWAASSTLLVLRERDYAACMQPRGYVVIPWRASNGEQVTKVQPEGRMSP